MKSTNQVWAEVALAHDHALDDDKRLETNAISLDVAGHQITGMIVKREEDATTVRIYFSISDDQGKGCNTFRFPDTPPPSTG